METKQVSIQPFFLQWTTNKSFTLQFILTWDKDNKRLFTITGPEQGLHKIIPHNPIPEVANKLIMQIFKQSNIPLQMTKSYFLNFQVKSFTKLKITDTLL